MGKDKTPKLKSGALMLYNRFSLERLAGKRLHVFVPRVARKNLRRTTRSGHGYIWFSVTWRFAKQFKVAWRFAFGANWWV